MRALAPRYSFCLFAHARRASHSALGLVGSGVPLVVAFLAAGCGTSMDRYSEVEDLRVLAVRTTPPLLLLDDPAAPSEVAVEALVVDPRGGNVDFAWSFCPVESSHLCADYDTKRAESNSVKEAAKEGVALDEALDQARSLALAGTASFAGEGPSQPKAVAARSYTVASFTLPTTTLNKLGPYYRDKEDSTFYGMGMGSWPSVILDVAKDGEVLRVEKKLTVSVADMASEMAEEQAQALALAQEQEEGRTQGGGFDVQFCSEPLPVEQATATRCVAWDRKLALLGNRNPEFLLPFQISQGESAIANWLDVCAEGQSPESGCAAAEVKAGESIRILPRFTAESSERYQVLLTDIMTARIKVEVQTEQISVSWFVTAGKVQDELTWPKFTKTLDTVYTAPDSPPAATDGIATLWLVARDQRGGIGWEHLDLVVLP